MEQKFPTDVMAQGPTQLSNSSADFKAQYQGDWQATNSVFSLDELRALRTVNDEDYVRFLASLYYEKTDRFGDPEVGGPRDDYPIDREQIYQLKERARKLMKPYFTPRSTP